MNKLDSIKNFLDSDSKSAKTTKVFLAILALGAVIATGALAPNIFLIFGRYKRGRYFTKDQTFKSFYNLKRYKLIEVKSFKNGMTSIKLSPKGEKAIEKLSLDEMIIPQPHRWDGKWRIFIFDLPVKYKKAREALRYHIKRLGLVQLQKSVWAYPYPCENEILFISKFFGVSKHVEILLVERMINDSELKNKFRKTGFNL